MIRQLKPGDLVQAKMKCLDGWKGYGRVIDYDADAKLVTLEACDDPDTPYVVLRRQVISLAGGYHRLP